MAESESVLLQRFVRGGDPAAFSEIVRRHAGLVYGTCLRVLSDADQAADATQETFFQLVKKADEVTGSVSGWLHRVAIGKAVDLIRSDARRRHREHEYVDARSEHDATWREVCPHVDEALNRLDDQTREILVRRFMEGQSMTALAEELGVSRPTISRRIESGLTKLRAGLHKRGVVITVAGLSSLLAESAAQSAPLSLLRDIGKVSLVGAKVVAATGSGAGASGSGVLAGGVLAVAKTKLVIATAAAVVIGAGLLTYTRLSPRAPQTPPSPLVVTRDNQRGRSQRQTPAPPVRPPSVPEEDAVSDTSPKATVDESPSPTPSVELVESDVESPETSVSSERAEGSGFQLDLSSPEATVRSFIKAMVAGDAESAMACFLPDGEDYEDMEEAVFADPDDPAQRSEYEVKLLFESLDPDAEMPMLSVEETEHGTSVAWQVTFKSEFTIEGHTFNAGDTMDFDGTLRRSGDSWLIDNL